VLQSYTPAYSGSGFVVDSNNKLHITVLSDVGSGYTPSIVSDPDHPNSYLVTDQFADGGQKIVPCRREDLPIVASKIALDYLLNQGIGDRSSIPAANKRPEGFNILISNANMMRIAVRLFPNLAAGREITRADYELYKKLLMVIINNDSAQEYMSDRVKTVDSYLTDSGKIGRFINALKGIGTAEINQISLSDVILRANESSLFVRGMVRR
jgi:hypothetical protein